MYCDISSLAQPIACTPQSRAKTGLFSCCSQPGRHLHERCKVCGLRWLTAFAGGE
jgi:hypothetical protein